MCFPSKKQKSNFTDDTNKPTSSTEIGRNVKSTKGRPASTLSTSRQTLPHPVTTQTQLDMTTPKVAIIIYTMYGHIGKRSFHCPPHIVVHTHSFFFAIDIQLLRQKKPASKVQAEKLISISTSSFHWLKIHRLTPLCFVLEWPKPFPKRSSRRCTLQRSPITLSSPLISWPPMMPLSWVSPPGMETCPLNGRYVHAHINYLTSADEQLLL